VDTTKNTRGNTTGNIVNRGTAAIQGDWIYYVSDNGGCLSKMHINGKHKERISDDSCLFINVMDDWIYYSNVSDNNYLYGIRTDGTERTKLNDDYSENVSVVGDWIYYSRVVKEPLGNYGELTSYILTEYHLYKIHTDGTGRVKIHDDKYMFMNVTEDWVYNLHCDNIYKIRTDGSEKIKLSDDQVDYVNVEGDWIYYCEVSESWDWHCRTPDSGGEFWGNLYKMRLDGTEKTKLNDDKCEYINVAGDWIYYFIFENLYKIRTDGSGRRKLRGNIGYTMDLSVVGNWIFYWKIGGDALIHKIRTNGTGLQVAE